MSLSTITEVKDEGGAWVISETVKTPSGEAVDAMRGEKGTLIVQQRTITQGPVEIDLTFEGGRATGTMAMGGQSKPVSVDLGRATLRRRPVGVCGAGGAAAG
jgi:hypothetical protein